MLHPNPRAGYAPSLAQRALTRALLLAICASCALIGQSPSCASASEVPSTSLIDGLLAEPIQMGPDAWYLGPGSSERVREVHNLNAADTINANQLWAGGGLGLNLTGAGTRVGIWDGGAVRATHQEFGSRVTNVDAGAAIDHATHVAGTIGAAGVTAAARGMANGVTIRSRNFTNDLAEMATDMGAGLIDLSNHSYGWIRGWEALTWTPGPGFPEDTWYADRTRYTVDPNFGKYDGDAQAVDQILNQNQNVLSVFSAGNDRGQAYLNRAGNGTYVSYFSGGVSGGPAGFYRVTTAAFPAPGPDGQFDCIPNGGQTSKNALVVGAINDITADPYNSGNVTMTTFSSWGPTDDGRLGVDIVANGAGVVSSISTSDAAYASFNGTSMAAPGVTGSLALLRQHTVNEKGAAPKAATLKGLAIHTAFDAGNVGPDYTYGWGVMDAAKAATFVTQTEDPTPTDFMLENSYDGNVWSMNVISDGLSPLKATLVWQDLAGAALDNALGTAILNLATPSLVNDLDLWIEDVFGNTYYPWNLNPGTPTAAAFRTALHHRENTEQVLVDAPAAGLYTIYVGHTGGSFTQNYSLLFSGAAAVPEPTTFALAFVGLAGIAMRRRPR